MKVTERREHRWGQPGGAGRHRNPDVHRARGAAGAGTQDSDPRAGNRLEQLLPAPRSVAAPTAALGIRGAVRSVQG